MSEKEVGKRPANHPRTPPSFPCPSCPRCSSHRTKFCYYNNHSVSQPRYFCKDCRRYWTHGGALRNIPTGGTSRKQRGKTDLASSSSQFSKPPPSPTWSLGPPCNPIGASASSGIGCFTQTPFKFSPDGVNAAFGTVTIAFRGGAPPPPTTSTPVLPHLSALGDFRRFGSPFLQRPPPPPSTWGSQGQNMALNSTNVNTTLTGASNFLAIARDPTGAANVANINDCSDFSDMENDVVPFQSYKLPSP